MVDDEENLHETLKLNLEMEGYEVMSAYNGKMALNAFANANFDLVILDVMMPETDGLTVLETLRMSNLELPVLILSAKGTSIDKVLGLKKGADDYLSKPFNLEELLLRVGKLLAKSQKMLVREPIGDLYSFGGNTIDFKAHQATTFKGEPVGLSKKEGMLLKLLIEHKGEVVTRERILQVVWGYNVFLSTRTIDNFILEFRKNFEQESTKPKHFLSARGVGYKFCD